MLPLISKSPAPPTQSSPPLFLSRSEESSQLPTSPKLGNPSTPPLSIPKKTRAELISLFLSPPSVMTNLSPCPTVNLATATFTLTTACTHDLLTLLDATIFLVDTRTTGSIEVDERENRTIAILTVECGDERMEELEREMAEGPSKWLLLNLDVQDHPRVLQERKYQRLIYEVKQLEEVSVPRSTGSGYGSGGNCGGSIRNDKMGRLGTATPKDARSSWRARAVTTMKNKLARGKNTKSADNSPVPPKSEVVRTPTKPITLEGSEHPAMFEKRHSKPTWSSKANPAKSFRKLTVLQANDEDGKHVYEVENTETKEYCVMKEMLWDVTQVESGVFKSSQPHQQPHQHEFAAIHLLHGRRCPGVVATPEVWRDDEGGKITMIYPMYPSDVFNYLEEYCGRTGGRGVKYETAVTWLAQLLHSISVQTKCGVVHGDLKLENLLLDNYGNVVICDYETSLLRDPDRTADVLTNQRVTGTPLYLPPELSLERKVSRTRSDMWALGVVAWELLTDTNPWKLGIDQMSEMEITNVTNCTTSETIKNFDGLPSEYFDVIKALLVPMEERLTPTEVMEMPLFEDYDFNNVRELFPKEASRKELGHVSALLHKMSPKAFLPKVSKKGHTPMSGDDFSEVFGGELSARVSEAWSKAEKEETHMLEAFDFNYQASSMDWMEGREEYAKLREWMKRQSMLYPV